MNLPKETCNILVLVLAIVLVLKVMPSNGSLLREATKEVGRAKRMEYFDED